MGLNESNEKIVRKDFIAVVVLYDKDKNELMYNSVYFIGNGEYYPSYSEDHIRSLLESLQEQAVSTFGNLYPVDIDTVIDLEGNVLWTVKEEEEENKNEESSDPYTRIHEVHSERTT